MIWAVLASSTVALQAHVRAASERSVIIIIGKVTFRDWERNGTILSSYAPREIAINDTWEAVWHASLHLQVMNSGYPKYGISASNFISYPDTMFLFLTMAGSPRHESGASGEIANGVD
jgi:hypothetical protein